MKKYALLLTVLFSLIWIIPSHAMVPVNCFDHDFVRGSGAPTTESHPFPSQTGPVTITVYNSAQDDLAEKVSSSIMSVDGVVVFDPSNFNQNVDSVSKTIDLIEGTHVLAVELRGKPGGKIRCKITEMVEADAAAVLGISGGVLSTETGAEITIPADVLAEDSIVTIGSIEGATLPNKNALIGPAVSIRTTHPLQGYVQIRLPITEPVGSDEQAIVYVQDDLGGWDVIPSVFVEEGFVRYETTHLSWHYPTKVKFDPNAHELGKWRLLLFNQYKSVGFPNFQRMEANLIDLVYHTLNYQRFENATTNLARTVVGTYTQTIIPNPFGIISVLLSARDFQDDVMRSAYDDEDLSEGYSGLFWCSIEGWVSGGPPGVIASCSNEFIFSVFDMATRFATYIVINSDYKKINNINIANDYLTLYYMYGTVLELLVDKEDLLLDGSPILEEDVIKEIAKKYKKGNDYDLSAIYDLVGKTKLWIQNLAEEVDEDKDGIPDDGDGNGIPSDNPCTGGETENCDDNCPDDSNPDQADADGDGVGDACDIQWDGDFTISDVTDIETLSGYQYLNGQLDISGTSLTNLDGLEALIYINGSLGIYNNPLLTNINGLTNLQYLKGINDIEAHLIILNNDSLTDLNGISNLIEVGDTLQIEDNDSMTNLGLTNLDLIGGDFRILDNDLLSTCLAISLKDQVEAGRGIGGTTNFSGNLDDLVTWYRDADSDDYGDSNDSLDACLQPEGYVIDNTDCDDTDPGVNPESEEVCGDAIDQDCDGSDPVCPPDPNDVDDDGDGFTENQGDCDDTDSDIYPDAEEICDNKNNDCNESTPDGAGEPWIGALCDGPDSDQCDEGSSTCLAGAQTCSDNTGDNIEICDTQDNDCNGQIDEGVTTTFYQDADYDDFGDPGNSTQECSAPAGYVADNTDCDDANSSVYPGAEEICDDGIDNQCPGDPGYGDVDEGCAEVYFGPQHVIATTTDANGALSVYAADLDGDGDLDVLSASDSDNKIAWYENQGNGTFGPQQVITAATNAPRDVYAADLDGDGDLDVLYTSMYEHKVAWNKNQGNGTFGPQQVITTAALTVHGVYAADLDDDGDIDVLSASNVDGKVAWYENQGYGVFGAQIVIFIHAAGGTKSVYAADLDGDRDLDVLSTSDHENKVAWFENQGNGTFGPPQIITTAAEGAISVYSVDLDSDGDLDVLSASALDDKVAWYENQGNGTFGPQQIITTSADGCRDVHAADLDGDGDIDVLSASIFDDKVAWYENKGNGTFGPQQIISTYSNGAISVYPADLDGDGDIDVLSASFYDYISIGWYENLTNIPVDSDNDGVTADQDCNDNDPDIYPGATEICDDGINQNCNDLVDCDDPGCFSDPACETQPGTYSEDFEDGDLGSPWGYAGVYQIIPDPAGSGSLVLNMTEGNALNGGPISSEVGSYFDEYVRHFEADVYVSSTHSLILGIVLWWNDISNPSIGYRTDLKITPMDYGPIFQLNFAKDGVLINQEDLGPANFDQWYKLSITYHDDYVRVGIDGNEKNFFCGSYQKPDSPVQSYCSVHGHNPVIQDPVLGINYYVDNIKAHTAQLPLPVVPTPTGLTADYDEANNRNWITWNDVPDADSYNLYWGTASGVTQCSEFGGNTPNTQFSHTGVVPGSTYYYKVTAVDANGIESALSDEDSASVSGGLPTTITRVSVAFDGTEANGLSAWSTISTDGRFVAFHSVASNLVPGGDTNGFQDIFVHDRITGATEQVSVASDGTEANSTSTYGFISADGRFGLFWSSASNLVPGDTNNFEDIFVHDRNTNTTERVSVASDGTEANCRSYLPSISSGGRFVTFRSCANNLVLSDTNGVEDIFVHDRNTNTTERVSVASGGIQANGTSSYPLISTDGRFVAFQSGASNLVPNDTNGVEDIFVHDRVTETTKRVSVASDGTEANDFSSWPFISADGRFVAFASRATNLAPDDTNGFIDIFVHDSIASTTKRVSVASDGTEANDWSFYPSISADGRYVVFMSDASNLVPGGDTNGFQDIFVHDRITGATEQVSVASDGTEANNASASPFIADGRFVSFTSAANNLVPDDTNSQPDVFVASNPLF